MPDADGQGPPDGLPGLPPEWGRVVVPDDASALADEARQVRRELRRARQGSGRRAVPARLGLPALILLVSMLVTLAGLAAVTWPRTTTRSGAPTVLPAPPPHRNRSAHCPRWTWSARTTRRYRYAACYLP
ncbi:hypothetical protein V2I01_11130 [Micromonospora sp. BRA006-A]|nr:hypothetical protein [Micromonospora sp. BRA006-A]